MTVAPASFTPVYVASEYVTANGPLFMSRTGDALQLGFRVEARHTNVMHMCHGGMIATFCDMLLSLGARAHSDALESSFMSTMNLQVDYIAPAPLGAWVQGEAQVLRSTGRILFIQALVTADGTLVARTSGIVKAGKPAHDPGLMGGAADPDS